MRYMKRAIYSMQILHTEYITKSDTIKISKININIHDKIYIKV